MHIFKRNYGLKLANVTILLLVICIMVQNTLCEPYNQVKISNINVDINKPIGYSIYRFRCFISTCDYEFDQNDISYEIWDIIDNEVIINQNLQYVYKHYGRNHLVPVLLESKKSHTKYVVEILNITLSRPMDSCSPFFLPKLIDNGWVLEKSPSGTIIKGLDHLLYKSGKKCTPQISFANKQMSSKYYFKINTTTEQNLYKIILYTNSFTINEHCTEYYSCRDYISLILSHKPTGTHQILNITINIVASGRAMPYITRSFVNYIQVPLGASAGTPVGQISVHDKDKGFDGELIFTMEPSPYFYVNVFDGKIFTIGKIDQPIKGSMVVSVKDRSCYKHSRTLPVKVNFYTVSTINIYKYPTVTEETINRTTKIFYRVIKLYTDIPKDSYVVSGSEYASIIPFNYSLTTKISMPENTKQLFYVNGSVVYYRGLHAYDKNNKLPSDGIYRLTLYISADKTREYTGDIHIMLYQSRSCIGSLPVMKFSNPFQIVNVGNFDTRIKFDSSIQYQYENPNYLVEIDNNSNINQCFNKKNIDISVVDGHGNENFFIDNNFGYISSKYPLYDPDTDYYILLQAVNDLCDSEIAYKGFGIVKLSVQLKNNKYIPFFHNSTYIFNISESLEPPSYVGSVRIRYADNIGYLYNSMYYYYLKSENTTMLSFVTINRDSGIISLSRNVDRESVPQLIFGVIALNPITNRTVETVVIINIDDEDDNPPVFPRKHVGLTLEHNSGYIENVLCIYANDKDDTRKFPITYFIHSGPKNLFHLSPKTGVLSLVGSLRNYVSSEGIIIRVRARDTKNYDEMEINILVEKSLDKRPLFNKFVHDVTLLKDTPVNTIVANFDVQIHNERINHLSCRFGRDISYTIASIFSIKFNSNNYACQLSLIRPLSYKNVKNILRGHSSFLLELYDNKRNIMFPAQCLVKVKLLLTDNKIIFKQKDYIFQHFGTIQPGSIIGEVEARNFYGDDDRMHYALESFKNCHSNKNCTLALLHSLFKIDKATGIINNHQHIDVGFDYDVIVSVINSKGSKALVSCKILIQPLSYKQLLLTIKPITITLSESSPVGTGYTLISDDNKNGNTDITLDIVGGNWLGHFRMVQNNTITLAQPLDYENIQSYQINYRWKNNNENTTHPLYFENIININVIDENDNIPIFPDQDNTFVIIYDLSVSRQFIAHFQAYDGDIDYNNRRIIYKLVNSKVSMFIHPTLGIASVTNDFTLIDRVMTLTVKAENEANPSMYALKNFSVVMAQQVLDGLTTPLETDMHTYEFNNMNIEFDMNGPPIQRFERKLTNHRPKFNIGRLFQSPFYSKSGFICGDPYGFINVYSIDDINVNQKEISPDGNKFYSTDLVYVYKIKESVYRIQNIVAEIKGTTISKLQCDNFNDDVYFLSNNNISQIIPKLTCKHPTTHPLRYTLESGSRSDFNDNVLTLGANSGVMYIHKLPDLHIPVMEHFTYRITDSETNDYVFGRVSIQIVNINYDIKISDRIITLVYVNVPIIENQFIYNPRFSDGRTSVNYQLFYCIESAEDNLTSWITIDPVNGHITAKRNYTLVNNVKFYIRVTLFSPNGENVTSTVQAIELVPRTLILYPITNDRVDANYTILVDSNIEESPIGLYIGRIPILTKGIYHYHCQVVYTNIDTLTYETICDNIIFLNQDFYISSNVYEKINHFKRVLLLNISSCNTAITKGRVCVNRLLNVLIIKPTTSAPYFLNCDKNHTIFVENYQPVMLPLGDMFAVSDVFEDVFSCVIKSEDPFFSGHSYDRKFCSISPTRYINSNTENKFNENLAIDVKPEYMRYYNDKALRRIPCSQFELNVQNYFPFYNSLQDNYGVVTIDEHWFTKDPIICLKKNFFDSLFSIIYPNQNYVRIELTSGCVYMVRSFNHSLIQRLSLIIKELSYLPSSNNRTKDSCELMGRCIAHHLVTIVIDDLGDNLNGIILDYETFHVPTNAPIGWNITTLKYLDYANDRKSNKFFFISNKNIKKSEQILDWPINVNPMTNALVIVDKIDDLTRNYSTNSANNIFINLLDVGKYNSRLVTREIKLNWTYVPISSSKPLFTMVIPINKYPGVIGKIEFQSLNPSDLSYNLYIKDSLSMFRDAFGIDATGQLILLKQLDIMLYGYNHHPVIDIEINVIDESTHPVHTTTIPVNIIISYLWCDLSLSFIERNFILTYDELAQFGEGDKIKEFDVVSLKKLSSNDVGDPIDKLFYSIILVPLNLDDNYLDIFGCSSDGVLYKSINNEVLRYNNRTDEVYALDLMNPDGDVVDSIIIKLVDLVDNSQSKCIKFRTSPIWITIHPIYKIKQLVGTIGIDVNCYRKNVKLEVYFNEFADCFTTNGRYHQQIYLTCDMDTLIDLLMHRRVVPFFVVAREQNNIKNVYNRLIMDFSLIYYTMETDSVVTVNITENLKENQLVTYMEPYKFSYPIKLSYILKCSMGTLQCPFMINSTDGGVYTTQNLLLLEDNQYNLNVSLMDNENNFMLKSYSLQIYIRTNPKRCNKTHVGQLHITINRNQNQIGEVITYLPNTNDDCYLITDSTLKYHDYFFLDSPKRTIYLSKKLPSDQNTFKFGYFLSPKLDYNKRDPTMRSMLTIEMINDDYHQIGFIQNKYQFKIFKNHSIHNQEQPIGIIKLNYSLLKWIGDIPLDVRFVGYNESRYFLPILNTNMSQVYIFLRRLLPTRHYINCWKPILELYHKYDMTIIDSTKFDMIDIIVDNVITKSPLIISHIGKVYMDEAFPQTALQIQLDSADLYDTQFITVDVESRLKSYVRFVRLIRKPNFLDVIIQSLWKNTENKKLISFDIIVGYAKDANTSLIDVDNLSRKYKIFVTVYKRATITSYIKTESTSISQNDRMMLFPTSLGKIYSNIPNIPVIAGDNATELPLFHYGGQNSIFGSGINYNNIFLFIKNRKDKSSVYFKNNNDTSLLSMSLITPPGNYTCIFEKETSNTKKKNNITTILSLNRINKQLYERQNHVVLAMSFSNLDLMFTLSNMFINPKEYLKLLESSCVDKGIRMHILSFDDQFLYNQQRIYMWLSGVNEHTNEPIGRLLLRKYLENCGDFIESSLSGKIDSYDHDPCTAFDCQLGVCISNTIIDSKYSKNAYILQNNDISAMETPILIDYYVYPRLVQQPICLIQYSNRPNDCMNNGKKMLYPIETKDMTNDFMCVCDKGFNGKYCQSTTLSFDEKHDEPVWYPSFDINVDSVVSFSFVTATSDGIILLQNSSHKDITQHFHFAVKLVDGTLSVEMLIYDNNNENPHINYDDIIRNNITKINIGSNLNDGRIHHVRIIKTNKAITVELDNCVGKIHRESPQKTTFYNYTLCRVTEILMGDNNVYSGSLTLLIGSKFVGCIHNLNVNDVSIDFGKFIKPLPLHVTLNKCGFDTKKCPKCKNGFCDRSTIPPYSCSCYNGWTGTLCDIRINSFYIKNGGYLIVDHTRKYESNGINFEIEKSEYKLYIEMIPKQSINMHIFNRILVYESNDDFTEYSYLRIREGYVEFVNNLGDGEYVVQFPLNFKYTYSKINSTIASSNRFNISNKFDNSLFISPYRNRFIQIIARRVRNMATIEIPYLGYISRFYGVNNLLDSNRKIFVGNAPNNSYHHINYNKSDNYSMCYSTIILNGIAVNDDSNHISKYNTTVDCPCNENNIICIGPSKCVGGYIEYCGCKNRPGVYCGYLQFPFDITYFITIMMICITIICLWALIVILIYRNMVDRGCFVFRKSSISSNLQFEQIPTKSSDINNCSQNLHLMNDIDVKTLMDGLRTHTDEIIHYDSIGTQDDYKPTFRYYLKESDEEEVNNEFKKLPPLNTYTATNVDDNNKTTNNDNDIHQLSESELENYPLIPDNNHNKF